MEAFTLACDLLRHPGLRLRLLRQPRALALTTPVRMGVVMAGCRLGQSSRLAHVGHTVSRAKIATTTSALTSASPRSLPIVPLPARSRTAVMRCDTGLALTNHWSQPGMVSTGRKALGRKVSGDKTINEVPSTLEVLRAITRRRRRPS